MKVHEWVKFFFYTVLYLLCDEQLGTHFFSFFFLAPELPTSLSVKLKICRSQVCQLIDEDFDSFRYKDLPHVYIFFKTSSPTKNEAMPLYARAAKCTLKIQKLKI